MSTDRTSQTRLRIEQHNSTEQMADAPIQGMLLPKDLLERTAAWAARTAAQDAAKPADEAVPPKELLERTAAWAARTAAQDAAKPADEAVPPRELFDVTAAWEATKARPPQKQWSLIGELISTCLSEPLLGFFIMLALVAFVACVLRYDLPETHIFQKPQEANNWPFANNWLALATFVGFVVVPFRLLLRPVRNSLPESCK